MSIMVYNCNPCTWKAKAGDHKFKASLRHIYRHTQREWKKEKFFKDTVYAESIKGTVKKGREERDN